MAKKKTVAEDQTLDKLNDTLASTGEKIIKNGKVIGWSVGTMLVVALGILAYLFLYANPRAEKALEAYGKVNATAAQNPNDTVAAKDFQNVANQYSDTKAGNLATLSAAQSQYRIGKYQEAINNLNKFKCSDPVLMSQALCLKGDCYVNLKKYNEALSAYDEAIKVADGNDATVPRFLDKKATVYDEQKQYAKALECYETIKKDYPTYENGAYPVDAFIAREKARLGK